MYDASLISRQRSPPGSCQRRLPDRRIEVYTQPSGPTAAPAYGSCQTYRPGDAVPLVLDWATVASIPVADLLP